MRMLLTNDDGIYAAGLSALAREAALLGEVIIIAPLEQQSARSHAVTIFHPIVIKRILANEVFSFLPENSVIIGVEGTPADCVKLGLEELLEEMPDVVIAGINLGANTGMDIFYSGTVASALEGVLHGIPSFAVSLDAFQCSDFTPYARIGMRLIRHMLSMKKCAGTLLNINIPSLRPEKIRGVRITRQDLRGVVDQYERREDPRGREYFWIRGKPVRLEIPGSETSRLIPTDVSALEAGHVSVTPIRFDLTDYEVAESLGKLEVEGTAIISGE